MLTLGHFRQLHVVKAVAFGVYLRETLADDAAEEVLLPANEFREGSLQKGDTVDVFLYKDSEDRLIATMKTPKITLGHIARLTVSSVTDIGAFLDWGLPKDLLLPFAEQAAKVSAGDTIPVALYIDKSERLCATMNLYDYLETGAPYKKNDRVRGTVYQMNDRLGAFIAVDDRYHALLPQREITKKLRIGDVLDARVTEVRNDGKLNLSLRAPTHLQMDTDAGILAELLQKNNGTLPVNDHSSPEEIREATGMSKAQFKRAVGRLLKEGFIRIEEGQIIRAFPQSPRA